jgi:hypothetical protein
MRKLFSIAATAALMLCGAGVAATELPTFEKMGFPITLHQVQVVGPAHVQERSPTPTLTLYGMPASPHQLAVLTPRPRITKQSSRSAPCEPACDDMRAGPRTNLLATILR